MSLESSSTSSSPSVASRIVSQVDFYLSDANMPRDKFLRELASKDADGWMPVDVIASFSRMKALCEDLEEVKRALRGAESAVFETDEEGGMIRRRKPMPEAQDSMAKAAYVKGFPVTCSLDDLLAFFKSHGKAVEAIRMRRFPKSKDFKGSIFVEFASESDQQAFLADAPKSYDQEHQLTVMSKMAYFESKNSNAKNNVDVEAEFERLANDYSKGCILKLEGVPENTPHQDVKKAVADLLAVEVAFVEQQQDGAVFVRLKEPKAAELVSLINEKGLLSGHQITASETNEEEEAKYYRNLAAVMISKRSAGKYRHSGNNNNKGKHRQANKKREASDDADEQPEGKIAKNDD